MSEWQVVTTGAELQQAIASGQRQIEVRGTLSGMPMITLPPGGKLKGGVLEFGAKGVRLTSDNELDGVAIHTADHEIAILNDTSVAGLGTITLCDVTTWGQVFLVARDNVRSGHVHVENLHVLSADVRGRMERPHGFGVDAQQGGFTLWNRQLDPSCVLTAELLDISIGMNDGAVRGSGVFIGGHGNWEGVGDGGTVEVSLLRTGEIHTDGGIAPGTPDLISGAVFVISGAVVREVLNEGTVSTHGQNDMVLDNWGDVTTWTAMAPVISTGPSGIGFVNFGAIDRLDVQGPIETFGPGARGFNMYDGSLRHASFLSITTHGNGSVGVQVSKPLAVLEVAGDIATEGGEGVSLVKGVQTTLKAIALSVKPGGHIGSISVGGAVRTSGDHVVSLEIDGDVGALEVAGGVIAGGKGSDGVHVRSGATDLADLRIAVADGQRVVRTN